MPWDVLLSFKTLYFVIISQLFPPVYCLLCYVAVIPFNLGNTKGRCNTVQQRSLGHVQNPLCMLIHMYQMHGGSVMLLTE